MTAALLITGETYQNRHTLRAAGCMWNRDEGGYLVAADKAERVRQLVDATPGLKVEEIEVDASTLEPLTGDALRAYRQERQDRRAERLRSRADAADRRAAKAHGRISEGERDFLRLAEPVKIGHHSEGRHRRLIERHNKAFDTEMTERSNARNLRQRAEWMQPAAIAGDAERARQAERDRNDQQIGLHAFVNSVVYGNGIVTKVNARTYTVLLFGRGYITTLDKSHVSFVRQGTAADVPAAKFKAGDKVIATRGLAKYEGTIKRVTSRGYSVAFTSAGRERVDTFPEFSIEHRFMQQAKEA